jgi:hypothetical protein
MFLLSLGEPMARAPEKKTNRHEPEISEKELSTESGKIIDLDREIEYHTEHASVRDRLLEIERLVIEAAKKRNSS